MAVMPDISPQISSDLRGIEAIKAALQLNPAGQRSIAWLGRQLGLTRGAVVRWDKIPEEWLRKVSEITGLAPSVLRPDLAELFTAEQGV